MKVTVYNDPGHAWAKVAKKELARLNIIDKISSYSYERGQWAYLEEDCDLSLFLAAKRALGEPVQLVEKFCNNPSAIRGYSSYRPIVYTTPFVGAIVEIRHSSIKSLLIVENNPWVGVTKDGHRFRIPAKFIGDVLPDWQ